MQKLGHGGNYYAGIQSFAEIRELIRGKLWFFSNEKSVSEKSLNGVLKKKEKNSAMYSVRIKWKNVYEMKGSFIRWGLKRITHSNVSNAFIKTPYNRELVKLSVYLNLLYVKNYAHVI